MAKKERKKRTPPPKDETKEAKFVRVCTPRVAKAVKAMNNIGNCAGVAYTYSEKQVDQIQTVLEKQLNSVLDKFTFGGKETSAFEFEG